MGAETKMSQYLENLIDLLRKDHPDLSGWTIICASDRAVDPLQNLIHRSWEESFRKLKAFVPILPVESAGS